MDSAENKLRAREAELARVQRIGQIGGLEVDLSGDGFRNTRSPEYLAVHGLPPEAAHETHEAWVARIHPEDRERIVSHFLATVAGEATDYEAEYRIIRPSDGKTRWILAKAEIVRDAQGKPLRLVGAHIDITARRNAEEQRELVARELSHRIANIFTVVNSLVRMAARFEPECRDFADRLQDQLGALHQAHGLILGTQGQTGTTSLKTLISRLLEPYGAAEQDRIAVTGDDCPVGPGAMTAVALIVHELATNAVKYGALSARDGRVGVAIAVADGKCRIDWTEQGGPPVVEPASRRGFGSVLVDRAARVQLGATIEVEWKVEGLRIRLDVEAGRIAT